MALSIGEVNTSGYCSDIISVIGKKFKKKTEKNLEPDSNLTHDSNLTRATNKLS